MTMSGKDWSNSQESVDIHVGLEAIGAHSSPQSPMGPSVSVGQLIDSEMSQPTGPVKACEMRNYLTRLAFSHGSLRTIRYLGENDRVKMSQLCADMYGDLGTGWLKMSGFSDLRHAGVVIITLSAYERLVSLSDIGWQIFQQMVEDGFED